MAKYSGKNSRLLKPGEQQKKIEKDDLLQRIRAVNPDTNYKKNFRFQMPSWFRLPSGFGLPSIFRMPFSMGLPFNFRLPSFNFRFSGFGINRTTLLGIGVGLIAAFFIILIIDFFKVRSLANFQPNVTTKIYDKNKILISELFRQKREVVPLNKIPKNMVNAIISIEDNEFYEHWGINPKGIVRAFFVNIFSGRIKQGGSTITQQLSKILMTSGERNIYRKIKEAFISLMMEAGYSKDEIISLYLNQIFFGHGAYGVEAASQLYFNKSITDLNLAECALLASLPSAPNRFSPIKNTKLAISRHRVVLVKMVEMGFITVKEGEKAFMEFWPDYLDYISGISPSENAWSARLDRAPWFTEYIRRDLVKKYGEETVFEKGLLVYTTLDINKQTAAQNNLEKYLVRQRSTSAITSFKNDDYIIENFTEPVSLISDLFDIPPFSKKGSRENTDFNKQFQAAVSEELEAINLIAGLDTVDIFFDKYKYGYLDSREFQKVEGCIVSINQSNGYIETLVGGSEFTSSNQLMRPMQAMRQPGSSIKPLLYAAAIESGDFTASTTVLDSPIVYLDTEGGDWIPENYAGDFYGFLRLRKALALSVNVCSIRIADKLGIEYIMKYFARLLHFDKETAKRRIPRNFSIVLGSLEVTPFELTRAYAVIANGGKEVIPFAIRYVEDREGNILENQEEDVKKALDKMQKEGTIQIIKPETAQVMISMMKSVISEGTGGGANPGRPAAGKTGTTNNFKDAWFVGFTPQLTSGIWIGYDKMGLSLGSGQTGGGISAPMWGSFMREAMKNEPVTDFPVYANLVERSVCRRSGMLPSESCPDKMNEIYTPWAVPAKECDLCANIDEKGHGQAAKKGPKENVSGRQKESIMKNLKDSNDSIIDDSVDDLLK